MSFSLFSNKKEDLKRRIIDDLVQGLFPEARGED